MKTTASFSFFPPFLLLTLLTITTPIKFTFHHPTFDPYATLSIAPTATPAQISKSYRLKARETHPDKNPSPDANEEFRRVNEAFEILSDAKRKREYDERVRREERRRQEQRRRDEKRRRAEEAERERRIRQKRELMDRARGLQWRVLKWSTLEQLKEAAVGTDGVYSKNVLIMFVGNKAAEKKAEEDYFFPYPFVGEEGEVGNDFLVVAKVRYNTPTPLTRQFNVPKSTQPHFVFAKKGSPLKHYYIYHPKRQMHQTHQIDHHQDWKAWVQSLLTIQGIMINHHFSPINLFVIRNNRIEYLHERLLPNYEIELNFHSNDRILAFDSRVDNYPGAHGNPDRIIRHASTVALLDTLVTTSEYTIHSKKCYDLSTWCSEWATTRRGHVSQCFENSEFMHSICPKTCRVCSDSMLSDIRYFVHHYPEHKMPLVVGTIMRPLRVLAHDVREILGVRKTAAVVLLVLGLLMAFNVLFFETATKSSTATSNVRELDTMTVWEILVLFLAVGVCFGLALFVSTPRHVIPFALRGFHGDFVRVSSEPEIYMVLLLAGVILSVYIRTVASFIMKDNIANADIALFALVVAFSILAGLGFIFYIVEKDSNSVTRWNHLWDYQKNAAFAFVILGSLVGMGFMPLTRLLKPLLKAENAVVLLIPNMFIIGGILCLSQVDSHFYSDLMHLIGTNTIAALALVLFGMVAGLFYMNLIDSFTKEDGQREAQKLKVD